MGGRYWITGVQLGMLMAAVKSNAQINTREILDEIEENQYIGNKNDFEDMFVP